MLSVTAEPDGWWYTALLPGGRRILAFHTDADLEAARSTVHIGALTARARERRALEPFLEAFRLDAGTPIGRCAAHGAWIERAVGAGWIAVGDAALACDPLSARGLFDALYTAFLGAAAVREVLAFLDGHNGEIRAKLDAGTEASYEVVDRTAVPFKRVREVLAAGGTDALLDYQSAVERMRASYLEGLHAWYGLETRWSDRPFWSRRVKCTAFVPPESQRLRNFSRPIELA